VGAPYKTQHEPSSKEDSLLLAFQFKQREKVAELSSKDRKQRAGT
jgi:hypothetical protein